MRILMIIDGLPGGGAEKTVLTLSKGLVAMGHQVSVFSLRRVCDYEIPEDVDYQVILDTCKKPWRKLTELSRRAALLDSAVEQAQKKGNFDLVLSHLHKTDRIVAHTKSIAREKLWYCVHGMYSYSYLQHRQGFSRWIKRKKIQSVYQNSNVVAVSQAVLHDITTNFDITLSGGTVIHNPFDIDGIHLKAKESCEMAGQDYLIHVGRFHEHKRHDRLISAYALSGIQAPLVLMGNGSNERIAELKAMATAAGVGERVIIKSFAPNPYPWIANARMLLLSSDCEGFGNVLVEALICQTPAVSTNCPGGPAEILTGELSRGLSGMSAQELADTMLDIYNTPPVIDIATIESYSIGAICQQYLSLATEER
ncbi:glycosyltransferase [Buttiauxella ferragutiae]|uniref:glycosyltransferase n=1 Tax=Buttiauxella ferragutiae TaxID=82989 RepID=UPI001F538DB2|nr:glycosyltransferase [Buttiauxella ferragutiae]UNK61335.1 glycosyltransferase [Buttiauxella ferragutiae]